MPSGQQIAEQNLQAFETWLVGKSDQDMRQLVSRGVLSRKEIAKECAISRSALDQNPRIKTALREAEDGLRERGVLPAFQERPAGQVDVPPVREGKRQRAAIDDERLKRLEQENAILRAENSEIKRQLEKYAVLREALATTGRLPR